MGKMRTTFFKGNGYVFILLVLTLALAAFSGCGGGSSAGKTPLSGTFTDSPVEGLIYQGPTLSGTTDAGGTFKYYTDETVSFFIGSLTLGSAAGSAILSPIDLVPGTTDATDQSVINMARFLQSLDADGDLNNGIQITTVIADAVSSYVDANGAVNFNQTPDAFSNDTGVATILAALNAADAFENTDVAGDRTLRNAADAQAHLENSLKPPRLATVECGELSGYADGAVAAWRGIPYAKPPVGDLRWKAPQDPEPWTGTRWAIDSGQPSVQFEMDRTWHQTGRIIGSEDCLTLDIFRPDTDDTDLPVYCWIHGGSNKFGSAAAYNAYAMAMAGKHNVVVVQIQYRLGPMGWFRHADLQNNEIADMSNSGNFGTLDQIQALKWVKNNIAVFGGDPDNVTIAGQSAGGHNVMNLFISPLAAGLFHKAVSQSGIMPVIPATDAIAEGAVAALGLAGDDLAVQLRGKTAREIVSATAAVSTFNAFADGYVLPDTVINALHQGIYNKVPIIIGFNENEWNDFVPLYGPLFGKANWSNVYDIFDPTFDPANEWTYADIFPNENEEQLYEATGWFGSLSFRAKYLNELVTELRENQENVYAYLFKWAGGGVPAMEDFRRIFGAAHAMEIPFFFGADDSLFSYSFIPENETGRKALQTAMGTYLMNFIQTGVPGACNGFTWEPWSNNEGEPKALTFDADANNAILAMETDEWTFDEVTAALDAEIAGWDPAFSAVWGAVPASQVTQTAEALRFVARNHLQFNALDGATSYYGTYGYYVDQWSGYQIAGYRVEIPDDWNGDLVLYCHGYRGDAPELSASNPDPIRQHLIENGYAWASSTYGENGYSTATGVIGTHELLKLFNAQFDITDRAYIMGHSMGGHVTARSVTQYPDAYDGALPMCGVVGGAQEQFSFSADMAFLANYFSGLNYDVPFSLPEAGTFLETIFGPFAGPVRTGDGCFGWISASPVPAYTPAKSAVLNAVGETFKDATMYRSGGKRPIYHAAFSNMTYFQINSQGLMFAMDPGAGAGRGSAIDNWDYEYHLDDNFDVQSAEEAALNDGIQRVRISDIFDFEDIMYPVYGNITIPVLSMHDIGDFFVPFSHEKLYAKRVRDAGRSDLLRTRIIRSVTHCGMNAVETAEAFDDLVAWVEEGIVPAGDNILDPDTVAADDFGCVFTRAQRIAEDPSIDHDDNPATPVQWTCDCEN